MGCRVVCCILYSILVLFAHVIAGSMLCEQHCGPLHVCGLKIILTMMCMLCCTGDSLCIVDT